MDAGCLASSASGRVGRAISAPPQFGHLPSSFSAHCVQNVHSNEQIIAPEDSGARSASQHSQLGRSSSTGLYAAAGMERLVKRFTW